MQHVEGIVRSLDMLHSLIDIRHSKKLINQNKKPRPEDVVLVGPLRGLIHLVRSADKLVLSPDACKL